MNRFAMQAGKAITVAAAFAMTAGPVLAQGWGGNYRHRDRDRIDAGDVFAGVLILGGIAAVASAASKSSKNRRDAEGRYPDRDYRDSRDDRDYREDYRREDYRRDDNRSSGGYATGARGYAGGDALNRAVDTCVDEIERGDRRVESVDAVNRDGSGWRVNGRVSGGRDFNCGVDDNGQLRSATVDGQAA